MRSRITKGIALLAILCVLATLFAVPLASAASYRNVYGQTQTRVRVRASASSSASITDNILKDACVYATESKTSGSTTYIKVRYRNSDGDVSTGWVCQSDSHETYVKILSTKQAEDIFDVDGGDLPSKRVGTFSASERKSGSSTTTVSEHNDAETIKSVQRMLKELGYYYGEITGRVGERTKAAIKQFQGEYDLSQDGVAGPQTIAKLESVYGSKASSGSSSSSSSGSGLRRGSTGTAVRNLQSDLTALGYYWATISGSFGEKTETAVKLFQEKNNLTPDGIAGTKTLEAIARALDRKGVTSSSAKGVLKLNSQGDAVSQLQTNLKQLGYYYASITGNFGSKTEEAVKDFQKAKGLAADGVAGEKTLDAISAAIVAAGGSVASSSSGASGLKLGSTGAQVSALQTNLTTLGFYYADITGHFGSSTQTAVKKFQKSRGLTQDGVAGSKTLDAIESAIKNSGGTVVGSAGAGTALREGDRGTAVTELQTMLHTLGYYYGDITDHFGDLTRKAVRAFQDDNGLTVDGIAGVNTINKLRALTGSSGSGSVSSSGGTTVSTTDSYGRIIKDNVYLRSSYSASSAAKASLSKGTKFRISKVYTVGEFKWYYITVAVGKYTYTGYVRSDMIEMIKPEDYGAADSGSDHDNEVLGMIRVTADNVALRTGPGTNYESTGRVNTGDVFYYIDTEAGWFRTRSGYWISKDYVKVMDEEEEENYVGSASTSSTYKLNDTGTAVKEIQQMLKALGYFETGTVTGSFGTLTKQAVMDFQRDHGLSRDGVVGAKTMAALIEAYNAQTNSGNTGVNIKDVVYDLDWYNYKAVYNAVGIIRDKTFTVTDLKTGKSFKVYVQSTGAHADVEPATAEDTRIMCSIYGVSDPANIKSTRRALIATVGNYQFACSMYGQPHGSQLIKDNGYEGQFCIHFRNSKTSETQLVRPENQTPIDEAVKYAKAQGNQVLNHLELK